MTDELKPCPFCGSDRVHVISEGDIDRIAQHYVTCENCRASTYRFFRYRKSAINAWNKRVSEKLVKELKND